MPNSPRTPRPITWEILKQTRNEAVIDVLVQALDSPVEELRRDCLEALLKRDEASALSSLIVKWNQLTATEKSIVADANIAATSAVRQILASDMMAEKSAALEAINDLHLGELVPDLVNIVCQSNHPLKQEATERLLSVCDYWGQMARSGRDVPGTRGPMLDVLYQKLLEYSRHRQTSLLEAWCVLTNWDDSLQRGLISDPLNDGYRPLLKHFGQSTHPSVLRLLAGYLWRPATPKSIQRLISERTDPSLVIALVETLGTRSTNRAVKKLHELAPLACFVDAEPVIRSAPAQLQGRLWLLFAASTDNTAKVLEVALALSRSGSMEGRATAAEMIRVCRKVELEKFVWAIQKSSFEGPANLGDALEQLAMWIKHPSSVLQKAAREFFEEFTLTRLLDQIRRWPSPLCKSMARIVRQTEEDLPRKLIAEMHSPSPKRRVAAIQATQMLELSQVVSEELLPMVHDPRLEIRVRVIDLLSALGHRALDELLPRLLDDASTDVQEAAARAVRRQAKRKSKSQINTTQATE